jgi:hypothetical protein
MNPVTRMAVIGTDYQAAINKARALLKTNERQLIEKQCHGQGTDTL